MRASSCSDPALPKAVRTLLAGLPILDVEPGFWQRAGLLRASVLKQKKKARVADALIAQSCLDQSTPLVTRDKDFRHLPQPLGCRCFSRFRGASPLGLPHSVARAPAVFSICSQAMSRPPAPRRCLITHARDDLLLTAGLAQAPAEAPPGADYPPGDIRIWTLQQGAQTKKATARKTAADPASPDTCRALMEQEAVDRALDCVKRIIDTQPSRMAEALPALWSGLRFSDGTRDYSPRLREIVAAGRAAAAKLPREEAAAAAYQLLPADDLLDPSLRARGPERQAAFIEQYAGTAAAWLG